MPLLGLPARYPVFRVEGSGFRVCEGLRFRGLRFRV